MTLALSFYRQPDMLRAQLAIWESYPPDVRVIVVDDGSPEPALPILEQASPALREHLALYRIKDDIPWNREEARNLAVQETQTPSVAILDLDHVLPAKSAASLLKFTPDPQYFYRFPRYRIGKADDTRKKDKISPNAEFGEIKPHMDSYLVTKSMYMKAGGYDLAFVGCLGGGSEFLRRLEAVAKPGLLPSNIPLHVYTRSVAKDASISTLSRDREEGKRRAREKLAQRRKTIPCEVRSPWERQL